MLGEFATFIQNMLALMSALILAGTSMTVAPTTPAPQYKEVLTTVFWVGEKATSDNGYIANDESYWDGEWQKRYGGVDDPKCRKEFHPCGFVPKENPFYFALPYGEYQEDSDELKNSVTQIPWARDGKPLLKNRWIEVKYKDKTCYGQWQDVGPFLEDDVEYVFGTATPSNTYGEKAGLDVSPALWDCLGLSTNAPTRWRFVGDTEVPAGPWSQIKTVSDINW